MKETINIKPGKKVYFASDFHLGAPNHADSLLREKKIVAWLESIRKDAQVVFLVGDLFDFWFEYKRVVPKGFVRLMGKLAEMSDEGIELIIFTGNHDMWMYDYFQEEIGAKVYRKPKQYIIENKTFYVAHGDGMGPGDPTYKLLKVLFESSFCQFFFGRILHPNFSMMLGSQWSLSSWKKHRVSQDVYHYESPEKEHLFQFAQKEEASGNHHDYYIFGHRHYKLDLKVNENCRYVNLGDWIYFDSYAIFDGGELELKVWENE